MTMDKLYPSLSFAHGETPLSWAARLAAFHTGGGLRPFLNDMDVPLMRLAGGHADAIRPLCELAGQDHKVVEYNTIRSLGRMRFSLRCEVFSKEFMTGAVTRFCPACLAEDESGANRPHARRRARLNWLFTPVRICPHHQLPLIQRRRDAWDNKARELRVLVPETGAELLALAASSPKRPPSPLQDYVIGLLDGVKGPEWLDGQGIEQAVRATEVLGAVLKFGADAKGGGLKELEWDEAGRTGWVYVSGGQASIREALDVILADARHPATRCQIRDRTYGMLYSWLARTKLSKEPGPIRGILREHILDNFDVKAGQPLLGKSGVQPRHRNIASLAASEGVHDVAFKDVLRAKGVIQEDEAKRPASHVLVDYEIGKAVAAEMKRAVAVTLLPKILNASRPMVAALIDEGLLTPLHDGGLKLGKISRAVDREHVDALLARIERIATPVADAPENLVSLAKSAEISRKKIQLILSAVFGGRLQRVMRLEKKPGLSGLLVDPREVKSLTPRGRPGMSAGLAFMMLGIGAVAGKRLISGQFCERVLKTVSVPGEGDAWVTPAAMACFRSRYVTFKSLLIEAKCKQPQLKQMLAAHEVTPAFDPKTLGAILYRRADLPESLGI
ncbi:TniQ family protein [Leisingera daeponensis]|uniref:TniQ family protein n=1 Tax=Leisingera daeponensis TaxID=405746 RepID=UPI00041025C1|nr:TniQ family protein [Leisingera daeponensis]